MALHFYDERAGEVAPGDDIVLTGAEAHHAAAGARVHTEQVELPSGLARPLDGVADRPDGLVDVDDHALLEPRGRHRAVTHDREPPVATHLPDQGAHLRRADVDADGRVIGRDGQPRAAMFAIGPFTSSMEAGAFTRPRSDALSLRQTDRIAGAVSVALAARARAGVR